MSAPPSPSQNECLLRFEKVNMRFEEIVALDSISFTLHAGETRVVLGAAGSGKTTLLKAAIGLIRPDTGKIYLFDQEITGLKEAQLFHIRSGVGVLFQEGGLFDSVTVEEYVAYPLLNRTDHPESLAEAEPRVREALRFVELEQTLEKFPSELSGGMRRRVGIARAIVTEPPMLLYDSPTAGLDPITANTIINLIIKERDLRNAASILVTHRFQDGHLMADFRYNPDSGQIETAPHKENEDSQVKTKFFVMNEGRLVFVGTRAELRAS